MNSIEQIVIDRTKYDCVSFEIDEVDIMISTSESKVLLEIYKDRREVPLYFRGINKMVFILSIIEQIYARNDDRIVMKLKIA